MHLYSCSIFQERLQRSGEQLAAEAGLNGAAGAPAAEPSVSFFGLIKEGRLSRNQAATLFYQVCGELSGRWIAQQHQQCSECVCITVCNVNRQACCCDGPQGLGQTTFTVAMRLLTCIVIKEMVVK